MAKVVGIKFKDAGKLYYFSPGEFHVGIGDNRRDCKGTGIRKSYHG